MHRGSFKELTVPLTKWGNRVSGLIQELVLKAIILCNNSFENDILNLKQWFFFLMLLYNILFSDFRFQVLCDLSIFSWGWGWYGGLIISLISKSVARLDTKLK